MAFKDTIRLAFGNSLIMGHCPDKLPLEKVAEKEMKEPQDIQSFGLFDTNTANYNTYYPEVTAEDLTPKDGEFVEPVFRALSEVIVHKQWNPVDFSQNGTLKKSMSLLKGQTVNADHETAIANAMGAVKDVAWQESYKTPAGIIVPAGINAKLKIDGKSHPKTARGIMMDPPSIHSTSVTVQFLWEKSHESLSEQDFWAKLGTFDKDGKLIRRIASKVNAYHEISLVSHGADPFAQRIKDGQLNNPKYADVVYNAAHPDKPATKYFIFNYKEDLISNAETTPEEVTIPPGSNNKHSQSKVMNKQFLLALAMVLGLKHTTKAEGSDTPTEVDYTEETITEDVIQNAIPVLVNERNSLRARPDITADEVTRLKGIETEFNKLPKDTASLKAFMDGATEELRKETLRNLGIVNPTPSESLTKLIEKANYETLQALNSQYAEEAEKKFPMACKDCNSTNVSRASSTITPREEGKSGGKQLSAEEVAEKIRQDRNKQSFQVINAE